jgi:acyl-CoA dehydrogenase
MSKSLQIDWKARVDEIGPGFAAQVAENDRTGQFVASNYAQLAQVGLISAAVPHELGGGGASHAEICEMLRHLARYCGSTALAHSMHQHLVGVTLWKYLRERLYRDVRASAFHPLPEKRQQFITGRVALGHDPL